MKRRACSWCVRVVCSCGWTGYRGKSANNPRPCPICWGWREWSGRTRTTDVRHRMSTVCHFIPAAELVRLKTPA